MTSATPTRGHEPGSGASVCVVVSTFNRRELLEALVTALGAQTVERFEAVIVDDGSTDGTDAELRRLVVGDDRFRVLRSEENRGQAAGRNRAWRATTAPWVAFTDDDCVPEPTWLERLLAAGHRGDVVQGRTLPLEGERRRGWFDHSQRIESWNGRFQTCNLLVRRDALARVGGFDERLRVMGEDTDLGLRMVADGAATTFAADAVVWHVVWPAGLLEYVRTRRRYAEVVKLMALNPAARSLLHGRVVLRGVHLLWWATVVATPPAVALGVGWAVPIPGLAWIAWNAGRTAARPFSLARRLGYSALHLLAFSYEAVCFAVASVRHRTVVV